MIDTDIAKKTYSSIKKFIGIKIQEDGSLTRTHKIYDVQVADFIVEIDRDFLSKLTNKDAYKIISNGMESCKHELKEKGLNVLSSHLQSNPSKDNPHILLSVEAVENLNAFVDNINKQLN